MLAEVDLYKNIYLQAKNPICVLSSEGEILQVNPAHENLFSSTNCLLVGDSFSNCISTDQFSTMLDTINNSEEFHCQTELTTLHGKILPVDISASGIRDDTGEVSAIIVISRDQTQRRASDNQLMRFHSMVNQSNDAFFIIDAKTGRILDVNLKASKRWGYTREEMLQRSVVDLNPTYAGIDDWLQRIGRLQNNVTSIFETIHRTASGETFPVEISRQYVKSEDGDYIISVVRDISERKVAEAQKRKAQQEWERTFNSISDIITIQNLDDKIIQCNQATQDTFNLEKEECLGKHCYELFSGTNEPCSGCPLHQVKEQLTSYTEEVFHHRLGKSFSITVSPILDDDGEITGIAHFAKDITEKKKLEGQLRQAQKMESLGTLAGGIAHDFNNILSSIMGYAQLTQLKIPQHSEAMDSLSQITIGAKRAAELVKQILTFSRKTEYHMASVEVQEIISEALKLLRPSLPTTIEVVSSIDQSCPPVFADAGQIHQVLMNLCTNAYHAMREQKRGVLEISLKKVEDQEQKGISLLNLQSVEYLLLQISDNGTGMDKKTLEKIFEPYFTTKKMDEGTGLGLAVVHGIVQDFGGHISVHSEPGKGSHFNVYLPLSNSLPMTEEKKIAASPPMGTERLLVVDDEESISNLMKSMLERYGYSVTNTSASSEALQLFKEAPELFDLVVTDYAMPNLDGVDLATELLKVRPELPIVLCTGFNDDAKVQKALQTGIKACIHKPVQAEELALTVRHTLDRPLS
jgi:PAS domain S-box-containing protein